MGVPWLKRASRRGEISQKFFNTSRLLHRRMSSSEFGLAAVYRVIKKAGAERVGDDAAIELRSELEALGIQISRRAVTLAAHAGRKTVKPADIKLAAEEILKPNI